MNYRFEDRFVRFRWDDSLKGKKVFYADNIKCLENDVAEGEDYKEVYENTTGKVSPFHVESANWKFVYYDPNYEVKLAYEKGEQIQYKAKDTGNWCDWNDSLSKCPFRDDVEYRTKPASKAHVISHQIDIELEEDNAKEDGKELQWTDLEVGNVITNGETTAMVVVSSSKSYPHIFIGYRWLADVELKDWRKVKNV